MFLDEARIAAQLHHPNIIQMHELGKLEGSIFIAMEYVDGRRPAEDPPGGGRSGPRRVPYGIAA